MKNTKIDIYKVILFLIWIHLNKRVLNDKEIKNIIPNETNVYSQKLNQNYLISNNILYYYQKYKLFNIIII